MQKRKKDRVYIIRRFSKKRDKYLRHRGWRFQQVYIFDVWYGKKIYKDIAGFGYTQESAYFDAFGFETALHVAEANINTIIGRSGSMGFRVKSKFLHLIYKDYSYKVKRRKIKDKKIIVMKSELTESRIIELRGAMLKKYSLDAVPEPEKIKKVKKGKMPSRPSFFEPIKIKIKKIGMFFKRFFKGSSGKDSLKKSKKGGILFKRYQFKKGKAPHHPLLAIDTEDDSKGNFQLGVAYGKLNIAQDMVKTEKNICRVFHNKKEMADFLNSLSNKNCVIVGFNLLYDLANLEPFIQCDKKFNGSRFITGKNFLNAKYIDICNHLRGSLEQLMPLVGMKKISLEDKEQRCISDAKATFLLGEMLEDFYTENCSKLRATLPSCGLQIFKNMFFTEKWKSERDKRIVDIEFESYRGGRVELFRKSMQNINSYDINGMYVSIMSSKKFPNPNSAIFINSDKHFLANYQKYEFGIVQCKVSIPMMEYPPLPFFDNGKLLFPVGEISATWTFAELRHAENFGCKILSVEKYIIYTKSGYYFRDYADWTWRERCKWKGKNIFMEMMFKLLGNAIYGKFGERIKKDYFYGRMADYKGKIDCDKYIHVSNIGGVEYLSYDSGISEITPHTFPILSSYVTSYGRIMLHSEMVKHDVVYCDTDSLKITDSMSEFTHHNLGGWKHEGNNEFEGFAPKLYVENGKWKAKGVKARSELHIDGDYLINIFESPNRFKESLKSSLPFNVWQRRKKVNRLIDNKRDWHGKESKPIFYGAFR